MPGADIWDDDPEDAPEPDPSDVRGSDSLDGERFVAEGDVTDLEDARRRVLARAAEDDWDGDTWLHEAQVVAHADDDGPHDGSRGVEVDEDESEDFGSKMRRWGTSSMLGASLSGIGFGIQKVLEPKESTQIEIEVADDTEGRLDPVEVTLGDEPDGSVAVLRPWLRNRSGSEETSDH